jgi:hypothetical protein
VGFTGNTPATSSSKHRTNREMADPWLALEVLRELDEAKARYFALTLHSPQSQCYLVSQFPIFS